MYISRFLKSAIFCRYRVCESYFCVILHIINLYKLIFLNKLRIRNFMLKNKKITIVIVYYVDDHNVLMRVYIGEYKY